MAKPDITIVDQDDNVIGSSDIASAHKEGKRHRIVRVFLFNTKGELFLQQRAHHIKSFPGLWDQSVGGHVDVGETYLDAARRETAEEIGLEGIELTEVGKYYTDTELQDGRLRRFNMLYTAVSDIPPTVNPDEVEAGKWVALAELDDLIAATPDDYTGGFIKALEFYKSKVR